MAYGYLVVYHQRRFEFTATNVQGRKLEHGTTAALTAPSHTHTHASLNTRIKRIHTLHVTIPVCNTQGMSPTP